MIRIYAALLFSSAVLLAQTGDALFTQAYSLENTDSAIQSVAICDDFLPDVSGQLGTIELWMLFDSGQPPTLSLSILQDNGSVNPNNAIEVFSSSLDATITDTGDDIFGSDIFHVSCSTDELVSLSGSQRYWLQLDVPVGGYWLCQNPLVFGSTMWVFAAGSYVTTTDQIGTAYDSFFVLSMPVALERNSWGAIKASF